MTTDGFAVVDHDVRPVNKKENRGSFYAKRAKIHPKRASGFFRRLKWIVMAVTLSIYYITPWLRWDRGPGAPNQAVLIDFAHRRFYFFFIELWPQEVYYVTGLLILAAIGIFLAAALFGRIWCGYACPQTVWTDLYIYVERWIEGDRAARMRLDKAPWSLDKAGKKIAKHAVWLVIAAATGGAWIFYFGNAPTLARDIFTGHADGVTYLFIGLLTFTTYSLAGTMREQVCTFMCPWPRIQAAMTDEYALSVTYRSDRGEPRGPHKKGASWEGRGDCIDCNQCVAACPQGIDIREGDQLECINCALCIDACDDIMRKLARPTGLIAYDTQANVDRRKRGEKSVWRFIRARTVLYASVMGLVGAIMLTQLINRATLNLDVIRDRSPPFVRLGDGGFRNDYQLKIINRAAVARRVVVSASGLNGIHMTAQDAPADGQGRIVLNAAPDTVTDARIHVVAPASVPRGSLPLRFELSDLTNGEHAESASAFLAGGAP